MFTGIIEALGSLRSAQACGDQTRLVFEAPEVTAGSVVGDSIAVNGCCLTIVEVGDRWWAADAVAETLERTGLGALRPGDRVNLERSLVAGARLGGHLVQGHVDGVGHIVDPAPALRVRAAATVLPYLVPKGSITVDGISLTIVDVLADGFTVAVVPYTIAATTLGDKVRGDTVNLEADVIAKYVEALVRAGVPSPYSAPKET